MSIQDFITDMLNIEHSIIEKIDTVDKGEELEVHLRIKHSHDTVCPLCNGNVKIHGYHRRILTHSTLVNRKCVIIYQQRRYRCPECEFTFHENNPFSLPNENLTLETKINVLRELKSPASTYTSTAARYNISATKCQKLFDAHVNIDRKTLPMVLSIDEHYFPQSSYDSLFVCILMDFNTGTIIDILPDRKKDYLFNYFTKIRTKTHSVESGMSELDNVKYVSIDLYQTYRTVARVFFPEAIVCADSFHVIEHLTDDFRSVRIRCRQNTQDKNMQYLLTKFKYVMNHDVNLDNEAKYNKRFRKFLNHRDIQTMIFERFPELKKAYELKEKYIIFNETADIATAQVRLSELIDEFANSGIEEYIEFYNLMRNWYKEIVNSFTIVSGRRINNSFIESRNKKIETLLYVGNGFINFDRTRNRILYCLNKDDSYKI